MNLFKGLYSPDDVKTSVIYDMQQKFFKPDMIKRWINKSRRNRNRRFQSEDMNSEEQKKLVDRIAQQNKDAFLGRSMGCDTKFNPKRVDQ